MINASTIGLLARLANKDNGGLPAGTAKPPTLPVHETAVAVRPSKRQVRIINETTSTVASGKPDPLVRHVKAQINGARVLDMIDKVLAYYARWDNEWERHATALWIAMTHFTDDEGKLALPAAPIWMAIAPPKCGKSRMLTLIAEMARDAQLLAGVITAPVVRNMKDKHMVPIFDEAHRIFKSGMAMQDLQALITSGYTEVAKSGNAKGGLNLQSNFGPVAMGAQPYIQNSSNADMLEDIFTRSYVIFPKRSKDKIPQLDETFADAVEFAQKALAYWGAQNAPEEMGKKLWPLFDVPEELTDRNYEIGIPLLAVADRAVDIRTEIPEDEIPEDMDTEQYCYRWVNRAREAALEMLTTTGDVKKVMSAIEDMNTQLDSLLS